MESHLGRAIVLPVHLGDQADDVSNGIVVRRGVGGIHSFQAEIGWIQAAIAGCRSVQIAGVLSTQN